VSFFCFHLENPKEIDERGVFGETVLHVACLCQNFDLAMHIAAKYEFSDQREVDKGGLVNAQFTDARYKGETALHIAIVNENLEMVKFLLSKPDPAKGATKRQKANPNAMCTGTFFDKKKGKMYMGGYPLSFAACRGNKEIVNALLEGGAKFSNRDDVRGNTVLHMVVLQGLPDMYDHIFRKCQEKQPQTELLGEEDDKKGPAERLELITNHENLTPLKLCAKKAKIHLFEHILKKRSKTLWTYGPWEANIFPLEELDSHLKKGENQEKSWRSTLGRFFEHLLGRPTSGALEVAVYTTPSFVIKPGVSFFFSFSFLLSIDF